MIHPNCAIKLYLTLIGIVVVASSIGAADAMPEKCQAILQAVRDVESQSNPDARITVAQEMERGVYADPRCGDSSAIIHAITSLLQDDIDGVRYEAAMSLGDIGPRAKSAVPSLRDAMKRSDEILDASPDIMLPTTYSGEAIRDALWKITGTKIPAYNSTPRPDPEMKTHPR